MRPEFPVFDFTHLPIPECYFCLFPLPPESPGQEDPLEKETAPHSSILAWRIPWTEEPGRLQSMGIAESDTTECLTPLNPHSFPSFPCLNNSFAWICPSEGLNSVVEVTSLGSWFNLALLPPAVQSLLRPHQGPLSSVPG